MTCAQPSTSNIGHVRCTITLLLLAPTMLVAQDDDTPAPEQLRKLIDRSVNWFELSTTGKTPTKLTAKKALRWENVSRGSANGLTVIYVGRGRAEAVCCIYPWNGNLVHEFGSLSRTTLTAVQDGETVWATNQAGLEFKPIPKAPEPTDTGYGRRSQMKRLARRFEATLLGWKKDNSDRQRLRLLPRPLFEYDEPQDVVDGAVFAFSMGVDPETLLILEAVEVKGKRRWEYALVRKTSGELEASLDKKVVWHADRHPNTRDPTAVQRNVKRPFSLIDEE